MLKKLIFVFIILSILSYNMYVLHQPLKEGYESYELCKKQGYPHDFCFQVPIQACLTNCGDW
jgi:hypothetical protein